MKALQVRRSVRRFGAARLASPLSPSSSVKLGPLELREVDPPACPEGEGWQRLHTSLSGICGSDLALINGQASSYFEDWVSFPLIPGHEVVGTTDDGRRVVLEPVLGHAARGAAAPWPGAAPADGFDYAHLVTGHLEPGIQTGFCCSTGGGWAPWLWAHESQLHELPDAMTDEQAVLVEPLAGAVHAALQTIGTRTDQRAPVIAVVGAGTMGLGTVAALRTFIPDATIVVGARYPHQVAMARAFGADVVATGDGLGAAVRRATGSHRVGASLSGGADAVIDGIGSSASISESIMMTRPRGRVVLLGMPARVSLDMTPLWHREVELRGCYTYGTEALGDQHTTSFNLAIELAQRMQAERLLSATYRIDQHVDAIAHAAAAGRRGAVKIAFDLRGAE